MSNKDKIDDILNRGVGEFIDPEGIFRKKLENTPEKVIIKFGVDPTRPDIHLGHAVVFKKLREFQDLGCKVVFLVGDYTAQIGDPTGKNKVRPELKLNEIIENMKTYLDQVGKILNTDAKVFSWIKNSDWYTDVSDIGRGVKDSSIEVQIGDTKKTYPNTFPGKAQLLQDSRMQVTELKNREIHTVSLSRVLGTLRHITHARLIARDMFKDRLSKNEELYMHEMLYPVLQGIDSHVLMNIYGSCDLEVGGTDQTFNMILGRDVMKMYNQPQQAVLSFKLLEGTDGKEKMSKSLDNYISIIDEPNDMYGKVMSIPDSSIVNYFELCTFTPLPVVEEIKNNLKDSSINPKDIKMSLAKQIVSIYHGEKKAESAEENFTNTFQKGEIPSDIEEIESEQGGLLSELLVKNNILPSKSEWRRLVLSNSIHDLSDDTNIIDSDIKTTKDLILKIGKKKFIKIKVR